MRPFKPFSSSLAQGMRNTNQNINRINSGGPSSFSSSLIKNQNNLNQNNLNQNNLKLQKPQNSLGQQGGSQQGGQNIMGGPGFGPGSDMLGVGDVPGSGYGAHWTSHAYHQGEMEGAGHFGFGGSMGGDAYDEFQEEQESDFNQLMEQGVFTLPDGSGYVISNMTNLYGDVWEQSGISNNFFNSPDEALQAILYLQSLQQLHEQGVYDDPSPGASYDLDLDFGSNFGSGGFDFNPTGFGGSDWSNFDFSNIDFNELFSPGASNMRNEMFSGGVGASAGINISDAGRNLDYATGGARRSQGFASQGKNIGNTLDSLIKKYSSTGKTI